MRVYDSDKATRKEMNIVSRNGAYGGIQISVCDSKGNIYAHLITIESDGFYAYKHAKDDLVVNGFDISDTVFGEEGELKFRGIK